METLFQWSASRAAVGAALFGFLLSAGCATDPVARLRSASLPVPPPAGQLDRQGKAVDPSVGGYANYKAVVDGLGMQVGEHHFDQERFSDYLALAGYPKLASEAKLALRRQALQDGLIEPAGGAGIGGGDLGAVAVEISILLVMDVAIELHNHVLQKQIDALARRARPFNGVADDYNSQVAQRFGLDPSVTETFPYRALAVGVSGPAEIGPNAALDDWMDDHALDATPAQWFLGYDRASLTQVESALAPVGADGPFRWSRRLPWAAYALGAAAAVCLGTALSESADPSDWHSAPPSSSFYAWGGGLACVGLGLEWKAMDLRTVTFQRYGDYLKARLSAAK